MKPSLTSIGEIALGSHHAHAINIVKTTGGFARLGFDVTLLCREPHNISTQSESLIAAALASYGEPFLRVVLETQTASHTPGLTTPPINVSVDHLDAASRKLGLWAARHTKERAADCAYARHFHAGLACAELGIPVAIETHAHKGDPRAILDETFAATRRPVGSSPAQRGVAAIITINQSLRKHYIARGAHPDRVHVVPDGVDTELFSRPKHITTDATSTTKLLTRDHAATNQLNAVYAGSLAAYKGIGTILACAAVRPNINFHLLGGNRVDQSRVHAMIDQLGLRNVHIQGRVSHANVPPYLWAADVLLLPPSGKDPSAQWTSPVKLAEYFAAQRPIVASRIPGLMSWADDSVVQWFEPDDASDMARALDAALNETDRERVVRNIKAITLAETYSYERRAQQILATLGIALDGSRLASPLAPAHALAPSHTHPLDDLPNTQRLRAAAGRRSA